MSNPSVCFSPRRLGFAFGVIWGLSLFILGLIAHSTIYYGHLIIQTLDSIYFGYEATVEGAFIGFLWGFCDAFIAGWLIAWVYNLCATSKASK